MTGHEVLPTVQLLEFTLIRTVATWPGCIQAFMLTYSRTSRLPAEAGRVRVDLTLGKLADEYLRYKAERGKQSISEDRRILKTRLLPALGTELPARRLTAAAIAQYERRGGGEVGPYTVGLELAILRHMLRLARRWRYVNNVPEIDMPKKPEGRRRYLDESEISRLLAVCRGSKSPHLATIVVLAINKGMRKSEILGLRWSR